MGEPRDARKTTAFLIYRAALLHIAREANSGAPDRLNPENRRRDSSLLVGRPAPVQFAVPNQARKRIHRPAFANRHNVKVTVKVQPLPGLAAFHMTDHVNARMC